MNHRNPFKPIRISNWRHLVAHDPLWEVAKNYQPLRARMNLIQGPKRATSERELQYSGIDEQILALISSASFPETLRLPILKILGAELYPKLHHVVAPLYSYENYVNAVEKFYTTLVSEVSLFKVKKYLHTSHYNSILKEFERNYPTERRSGLLELLTIWNCTTMPGEDSDEESNSLPTDNESYGDPIIDPAELSSENSTDDDTETDTEETTLQTEVAVQTEDIQNDQIKVGPAGVQGGACRRRKLDEGQPTPQDIDEPKPKKLMQNIN